MTCHVIQPAANEGHFYVTPHTFLWLVGWKFFVMQWITQSSLTFYLHVTSTMSDVQECVKCLILKFEYMPDSTTSRCFPLLSKMIFKAQLFHGRFALSEDQLTTCNKLFQVLLIGQTIFLTAFVDFSFFFVTQRVLRRVTLLFRLPTREYNPYIQRLKLII